MAEDPLTNTELVISFFGSLISAFEAIEPLSFAETVDTELREVTSMLGAIATPLKGAIETSRLHSQSCYEYTEMAISICAVMRDTTTQFTEQENTAYVDDLRECIDQINSYAAAIKQQIKNLAELLANAIEKIGEMMGIAKTKQDGYASDASRAQSSAQSASRIARRADSVISPSLFIGGLALFGSGAGWYLGASAIFITISGGFAVLGLIIIPVAAVVIRDWNLSTAEKEKKRAKERRKEAMNCQLLKQQLHSAVKNLSLVDKQCDELSKFWTIGMPSELKLIETKCTPGKLHLPDQEEAGASNVNSANINLLIRQWEKIGARCIDHAGQLEYLTRYSAATRNGRIENVDAA